MSNDLRAQTKECAAASKHYFDTKKENTEQFGLLSTSKQTLFLFVQSVVVKSLEFKVSQPNQMPKAHPIYFTVISFTFGPKNKHLKCKTMFPYLRIFGRAWNNNYPIDADAMDDFLLFKRTIPVFCRKSISTFFFFVCVICSIQMPYTLNWALLTECHLTDVQFNWLIWFYFSNIESEYPRK